MAITNLPYPNMDFVPLDVLTADELDQIVANIEAINNATINTGAIANGAINTAKLADGAVATPKVADGAITGAKIDFTTIANSNLASIEAENLSSLITPVSNNWSSRNNIKLYRYGNLYVLSFADWWVASISANSACNMGTINTSALGSAFPIETAITVINGDDGKILNNGRVYISASGQINGYCATARSGATSLRGEMVWIYK